MEAKKINSTKKNNVKDFYECTKMGDVAIIDGYKCTLVGVEDKIFRTIAWVWNGSDTFIPFHTKREAMRITKKLGRSKDNITKASLYVQIALGDVCWLTCEEVPLNTKIGASPINEDDIETTRWSNISNLESAMDRVLGFTCDMASVRYWSFDYAKETVLHEAERILDKHIYGLKEVDSELAGKIETCIKNIVEEVKPINNHDDFDWDEFNNYDIEEVLEKVKALIAKHDAENK